jgi:hypothetical protein
MYQLVESMALGNLSALEIIPEKLIRVILEYII